MTTSSIVLSRYPDAIAQWVELGNGATGWKIYRRSGVCWIALSATFADEADAWRDALQRIERKCEHV